MRSVVELRRFGMSIEASKKIETTAGLEQSTAKLVDQYAHFLKVPADDVIESALQYIFTKDKDFQQHIAKSPDAEVPSTLRVKKATTAAKSTGNGRRTGTPSA